MNKTVLALIVHGLIAMGPAWSQGEPAAGAAVRTPAPFATTRVEGTDNIYIFRYGGRQSIFVVTRDGVIATDPIGFGRPDIVTTYIGEIRKVTDKPIKYLIYSHHHFDHIAGGQPFKNAGATIIAHKQAKVRLAAIKDPSTPLPDVTVDKKMIIKLGGTTLELRYVGPNHSDSTLVMLLPKERILFAVDILPVGQVPGRGMIDFYPQHAPDSIRQVLKMDWSRLIPGHPGPGGRLGNKVDVQNQLALLQQASEAVKIAAREGKCWETAEKEVKLPAFEKWPGYERGLPFVVQRYCSFWGRGT